MAKVTAPRLQSVSERERVFSLLDEFADRRIIWVSAPAGYGKTTAVASYLMSRQVSTLWYQCDEGDADIASFFHFMSLCLSDCLGPRAAPPPRLSPENYAAISAFARNYFRAFFAQLSHGTSVVLDNWQDVPPGTQLAEMLPIIVEEVCTGIKLIVVSRTDPAPNLARLRSSGQLAHVSRGDLELSPAETAAIVELYGRSRAAPTVIQEMHTVTQGWAAGLALMLRHDRPVTTLDTQVRHGSIQAMFEFLSSEVFDRLDVGLQDFLEKTSCVEYITVVLAVEITGNPNARAILDQLVRRNSFTTYRPTSDTYNYHPLFRQFLSGRLTAALAPADYQKFLLNAAQCIGQRGDPAAAIDLFARAAYWPEAVEAILGVAPVLVQQARFQSLGAHIGSLPAEVTIGNGWLSYWLGVSQLVTDFANAQRTLERAYELFERDGNSLGQLLAAAAILQHIGYSFVDFRPMAQWISVMEALLRDPPPFPSPNVELRVMTGFLMALTQCDPANKSLDHCLVRVADLVDAEGDLPSSAAGLAALMNFFGMSGRTKQYHSHRAYLDALLKRPDLPPAARLTIIWMDAYQLYIVGDSERANALLESARAIAEFHGFAAFELRIRISRIQTKEFHRHAEELASDFGGIDAALGRAPAIVIAHARYLLAMYHLAKGERELASEILDQAERVIGSSGWRMAHAMLSIARAEVLCELERYDDANRCLDDVDGLLPGFDAPIVRFSQGLVRTEIARRTGSHQDFVELLAQTLAVGRDQGFANSFHSYAIMLPRLIPHALALNVEVIYCRWVIEKRGLKPPTVDIPNWPWRVRLKAMGHLEIHIDDMPTTFTGKTQRKPLDILKILLTDSAGVEIAKLMDLLWPDLEGDAARNAFDLAVHRLRKVLKYKDAVVLSLGRLMLNPDTVWADTHVLDALCAHGADTRELTGTLQSLLQLYRAPLLADEDAPRLNAARERLRKRFVRTVVRYCDELGKNGQWDLVRSTYLRIVEIDPRAAELYGDHGRP